MDEIDDEIMASLTDGKPHTFHQILEKVSFTHNTLRLHLDVLVDRRLVAREKAARTGRGRPIYVYSLGSGGLRAASMLRSGVEGVVALPFTSLSQVCRFEEGGFCKKMRTDCEAEVCPQFRKWV